MIGECGGRGSGRAGAQLPLSRPALGAEWVQQNFTAMDVGGSAVYDLTAQR